MVDCKIIIADDIFSNRLLLHNVLEQLGYDATVVDNGKKLVEELERNPEYEIVFTDIEMPVMNGLEVIKYIRKHFDPPIKNIPIVALTAHNLSEFSGKLNEAGFDDIMSKPYSTDKFGELLKKYLK